MLGQAADRRPDQAAILGKFEQNFLLIRAWATSNADGRGGDLREPQRLASISPVGPTARPIASSDFSVSVIASKAMLVASGGIA